MAIKQSLKKNFIMRTGVGLIELIFALFAFPYAASILNPEGIGSVDFATSTASYFILLSSFGISEYGIRKVAQVRDDKNLLSDILSKLFSLKFSLSMLVFLVYLFLVVPFFGNSSILFFISSFLIFSSTFNLIWALEGLEDFSYSFISKLISKLLFIVFLVLFVKTQSDVAIYFIGVIFFDMVYFLLSFLRLKVKFGLKLNMRRIFFLKDLNLIPTLLPIFVFILLQTSVNGIPSLILGKLNQLKELGELSASLRFFWISYYTVIPLTTVLLSRGMGFDKDDKQKEFHLNKSANAIITFALPVSFGLFAIAKDLISILIGEKFLASVELLQYLSILVFILSLNNFWGMQVIFANNGDRKLIRSNTIGLFIMLILSILLIPRYLAFGAAISLIITNFSLFLLYYFYGRRIYKMKDIKFEVLKAFAASFIMFFSIYYFDTNSLILLVVKIFCGVLIYFISLILARHKMILGLIHSIKSKS